MPDDHKKKTQIDESIGFCDQQWNSKPQCICVQALCISPDKIIHCGNYYYESQNSEKFT
jgi:hypothetical protein